MWPVEIEEGKEHPEKRPHPSILDRFREKIIELMEKGLNGPRIYEELKAMGSKAAYPTIKHYIAGIRCQSAFKNVPKIRMKNVPFNKIIKEL